MSDARVAFSLPLYGTFQGLIVLGYSLRPSRYRPLLFIPIAALAHHLVFRSTTGTIADVGLGGAIMTQMLFAFDGIVLTEVQKTLYRIGEKPGQIISAPFWSRLAWGWHLHNSPRAVGWAHEPAHIPKNPPFLNVNQNRKVYVLSRVGAGIVSVVVQAVIHVVNAANPALTPGATPLVNQSPYVRILSTLGLVIPAMAQMNSLHCFTSAILVMAGFSKPADWPPLFGSLKSMYSLQNFWRNVWHQMIRRPIVSIANFVTHTVIRFPHSSENSSPRTSLALGLFKLHTAFFISALVHASGEFMMLGHGGGGAFRFFILQGWGMSLEILVQYLVTGGSRSLKKNSPAIIWRLLGYVWVASWFIMVAPLMQQPMVEANIFLSTPNSPLSEKIRRMLALDVI